MEGGRERERERESERERYESEQYGRDRTGERQAGVGGWVGERERRGVVSSIIVASRAFRTGTREKDAERGREKSLHRRERRRHGSETYRVLQGETGRDRERQSSGSSILP
jgi:hypothetical protein